MQTLINNAIEQINQGTEWVINKAKKDKKVSYKALVKERRTLKKIRSTINSKATVVLYGASQCGKSHLVNILLSGTGDHIQVNDRLNGTTYDFLKRFNPPGGGESTGVITRFTITEQSGITKEYPLHIKLMSIKDIVLLLCDGYYNDLKNREPFSVDSINKTIAYLKGKVTSNYQQYITEDDIRDIEEYHKSFFSQDMYNALSEDSTDYFGELSLIIEHLNDDDVLTALNLLWNNDEKLSNLCSELFYTCKKVDFSTDTYVSFSEIDRTKGKTLLDVTWLERNDTTTLSNVYYKSATGNYKVASMSKSNLATICSEIILEVVPPRHSTEDEVEMIRNKINLVNKILDNVDILDFPGARARKKLDGTVGNVGEILRRGKVGYYFNKYTTERKTQILLFCWEPKNFEAGPMSHVIRNWIDVSIGDNPEKRSDFMNDLEIPPLFFVGTKYNDVLYQPAGETEGADFNDRWKRWFVEQLSQDIIGIPVNMEKVAYNEHKDYSWLESWTTGCANFDNIYLLRDFQYSKNIFEGWASTGKESYQKKYPYPNYYEDLRESFLNYPFVKKHFKDAASRWDEASEANCDGSLPIARNLASIVEKIATAAAAKNKRDVVESINNVIRILDGHHYNPNTEIALKKALDSAARLQSSLDHAFGRDPYYFGRFMKALTITEYAVHEVFSDVFAGMSTTDNVGDYAFIYLRAPGLKPKNPFADNLEILRRAYSFDNVENCRQYFEKDLKINLEDLFARSEFGLVSPSQLLAKALKCYWFDQWLGNVQKECLSSMLGEGTYKEMVDMLQSLFNTYEIERKVAQAIHNYVDTFGVDVRELSEMIADMCAEMINKFVLSVGYAYYSQKDEENNTGELKKDDVVKYLKDVNQQHNIGLSFRFVEEEKQQIDITHVAEMMAKMDDKSNIRQLLIEYSKVGIDQLPDQSVDELSAHIPGFRQSCRWRDLAKFGFVLTKDIPNYNIEDNDQLGRIIEKCKSLINN